MICDGTPTALTEVRYPYNARTIAEQLGLNPRLDEGVFIEIDADTIYVVITHSVNYLITRPIV